VALGSSGLAHDINTVLPSTLAKLTGTISGNDGPTVALTNATITVTDGSTTRTATSASSPAGAFNIVGLAPGPYSVTVSAPGHKSKTTLITIAPGVDQVLSASGSLLDEAS
jgi:hypothetical protein